MESNESAVIAYEAAKTRWEHNVERAFFAETWEKIVHGGAAFWKLQLKRQERRVDELRRAAGIGDVV
jgi:hypothetical protein